MGAMWRLFRLRDEIGISEIRDKLRRFTFGVFCNRILRRNSASGQSSAKIRSSRSLLPYSTFSEMVIPSIARFSQLGDLETTLICSIPKNYSDVRDSMETNLRKVFVHNLADVATGDIGDGTNIWQFVVVLAGAKIGAECNICAQVLIEGDVVIGDRVTIKCGVQLWDGLRVGNDVFIGPNATFTNDLFPRSKKHPEKYLKTVIEDGASIGAGAVILPGLTIGAGALVAAGAIVTRSVAPRSLVRGNPAKHIRLIVQGEAHEY